MKISIITPVYNAEKTIERTIQSVINQQIDSELEYIIIDGASTDNTLNIINRYSPYLRLISAKDNGVYDAMNKGIALATGDVIGIINSDDWYNNGALKVVEQAFSNNPHVSIVHSPVNNYLAGKYLSTFQPGNLENLVFKITVAHPSCFIKRELYNEIGGFDLSYSIAADYDLIFRAYISGAEFLKVDFPLASFSLDGMSSKLSNKIKLIHESKRVGSQFAKQLSINLAQEHQQFYQNWYIRELATLPLKYFDPFIALKVKGYLRSKFGNLSSDKYGAW